MLLDWKKTQGVGHLPVQEGWTLIAQQDQKVEGLCDQYEALSERTVLF